MIDQLEYLEAKRALDDRALNRRVLTAAFEPVDGSAKILEAGAGTLSMVERLYDWGIFCQGEWLAVDHDRAALQRGIERLLKREDADTVAGGVALGNVHVRVHATDVFEFVDHVTRCDLLVGCAFFDIVDLNLLGRFAPITDRIYAPITYNGKTRLEPAVPGDDRVLDAYRTHMERRRPGTPAGGDALVDELSSIEARGESTWVVEPPYSSAERVVVGAIVDVIASAVSDIGIDPSRWHRRRRRQLAAGELRYIAHNVDILGRI